MYAHAIHFAGKVDCVGFETTTRSFYAEHFSERLGVTAADGSMFVVATSTVNMWCVVENAHGPNGPVDVVVNFKDGSTMTFHLLQPIAFRLRETILTRTRGFHQITHNGNWYLINLENIAYVRF